MSPTQNGRPERYCAIGKTPMAQMAQIPLFRSAPSLETPIGKRHGAERLRHCFAPMAQTTTQKPFPSSAVSPPMTHFRRVRRPAPTPIPVRCGGGR
jgi:hypothetical protein